MESMELGGTNNQIRSTLKSINQAAIRVYNFFCIAIGIGIVILFFSFIFFLFTYDFTLQFLEGVGVVIPEEYWTYNRTARIERDRKWPTRLGC